MRGLLCLFVSMVFCLQAATTIPRSLYDKLKELHYPPTKTMLVVSLSDQKLGLFQEGILVRYYPVATATNGCGGREGSGCTPLGLHLISEKYGEGAALYTIFRARTNTHEVWKKGAHSKQDLILSRILCLDGLEEGINRGGGVDSHQRHVYIHGTNQEERIGIPSSKGCVRMKNQDVVDLYDLVPEGSLVWITQEMLDSI